jgi:hypothetical protein
MMFPERIYVGSNYKYAGLDIVLPIKIKSKTIHANEPPWVNSHPKN